jgi:hypothetical protein
LRQRGENQTVLFSTSKSHSRRWRRQRQVVALLEPRQVALHAQPLEPGGEARADEFQQQVQVRVPARLRLGGTQRHEAAGAAVQREAADKHRADAEFGEPRRVGGELASRRERVAEFDDAQVLEAVREHRAVRSSESPFITCGSNGVNSAVALATRSTDLLPGVEQRDAEGVDAGGLAQASRLRLTQPSPPSLVSPGNRRPPWWPARRVRRRPVAVAKDDLGGEEVRPSCSSPPSGGEMAIAFVRTPSGLPQCVSPAGVAAELTHSSECLSASRLARHSGTVDQDFKLTVCI